MKIYPAIRRAIDIVVSVALIAVVLPAWAAVAVGIKLTSPGPLLFAQTRGGRFGAPFKAYKFRTMRADHVHDPTEIVPLEHQGITRFGRLLRRSKLDETPQLFNVLKGDMSIIGPRPTIMDQVVAYNDFERRRLDVRPGITGLAQVNATAEMSWPERIKYDVYYVDHVGPLLDLWIVLKTLPVVLLGETRFARPFEQSPYASKGRRPPPTSASA